MLVQVRQQEISALITRLLPAVNQKNMIVLIVMVRNTPDYTSGGFHVGQMPAGSRMGTC